MFVELSSKVVVWCYLFFVWFCGCSLWVFHVCLFVILLLFLMSLVRRCDHLTGERGSWLFCFHAVCHMCAVCHGLFALPLGVIGWLFLCFWLFLDIFITICYLDRMCLMVAVFL